MAAAAQGERAGSAGVALISWTPSSDTNWGNALNWTGGTLPTQFDQVVVNSAITIGAGVAATAYSLSFNPARASTFSMTGGQLTTTYQAQFSGAFQATGGTFSVYGLGAQFGGGVRFGTLTTLAIQTGTVSITAGGVLAGTVTGAGQLQFLGGDSYLSTGFTSSVASILVGGKLGLLTSFTSSKSFRTLASSSFNLFGNTFTASGVTRFEGLVGNGTINQTGRMYLSTPFATATLNNGLILNVGGTLTQNGNVGYGTNDSGAKVKVAAGAVYRINGDFVIGNASNVGSLSNAGLLFKAFGARTASMAVNFSNTGTVRVASGTLQLTGTSNTLGGLSTGNGTIALAGGLTTIGSTAKISTGGLVLQSGVALFSAPIAYGGRFSQTGGVFDLDAPSARVTLSGLANLENGLLTGFGGTLSLTGQTSFVNYAIGGPSTVNVGAGAFVDQTGVVVLGESSNPVVNVAAGATWRLQNNAQGNGQFGNFNLAGTLVSYQNANANLTWNILSTGNIQVAGGRLTLSSLGNTLGGTLSGNGLLVLSGVRTDLLPGVVVTVGTLGVAGNVFLQGNLGYGGVLLQSGGSTLDLGGNTLTLTGTALLEGGELTDGGTLQANGRSVLNGLVVGAAVTLAIGGTADQASGISLVGSSGAGTLLVRAGASYTVADDVGIQGSSQSLFSVLGTLNFAANGASGISSAVNLAGQVNLDPAEQLILSSGGTLGGAIQGGGTLTLNGGAYALATGLALGVGELRVVGGSTVTTQGTATTASDFDLIGGSLTVSSSAPLTLSGNANLLSGTVNGTGTVTSSGSLTLGNLTIAGAATLSALGAGTMLANNGVQIGDSSFGATATSAARLAIGAGANLTFESSASINGNGTLQVAGALTAAGPGVVSLNTNIVDTGTIFANLGTINVMSAVTGNGSFSIGGTSSVLAFTGGATIGPATRVSLIGTAADLWIATPPSAFRATLTDFGKGDLIEFSGISTSATIVPFSTPSTSVVLSDGSTSFTLTFATAVSQSSLQVVTSNLAHGSVAIVGI